jgi:PKD repeat protein
MISGTAPVAGIYVITVAVVEKRNGQIINVHRRDLHLKIADCSIAAADLDPITISCDGFTVNFKNNSTSPLIKTFDWDFGVTSSTTDVSTASTPSFTYPVAGDYTVRLITNKNDQCSDTGYTVAKVYPGFTTDFTVQETCKGVPYVFTDGSKTIYGTINQWKWDFGNTNATNDTAVTATASYVYPQTGVFAVSLIVSNSNGCVDTVLKQITVADKPTLIVPKDTLICNIDTLQLAASGVGVHSWSPNYSISNTGISNPLVIQVKYACLLFCMIYEKRNQCVLSLLHLYPYMHEYTHAHTCIYMQ